MFVVYARRRLLGRAGGSAPDVEGRILAQDRRLQLAQRRSGLDTDLLDQHATGPAEGAQRVGLAARAVEGEHQLGPAPLPQRVGGDRLLELGDEQLVAPGREEGIDAVLVGECP